MKELLKNIFIAPFNPKELKNIYSYNKKTVLLSVLLFLFVQFLIVFVPVLVKAPSQIKEGWNSMKTELRNEIAATNFSYIGIVDDQLVTDLSPQPYIKQTTDGTTAFTFKISPQEKLDLASLNNKYGKKNEGFIFFQDGFMAKDSRGKIQSYQYADIMNGQNYTLTKTRILKALNSNEIENFIKSDVLTAQVIIFMIIGALFVLLVVGLISVISLLVWSAFVGLFAQLFSNKGTAKRFASAMKLSIFAYMGSWYVRTLVSALTDSPSFEKLVKWVLIAGYVYLIVTVLNGITKESTKEENSK